MTAEWDTDQLDAAARDNAEKRRTVLPGSPEAEALMGRTRRPKFNPVPKKNPQVERVMRTGKKHAEQIAKATHDIEAAEKAKNRRPAPKAGRGLTTFANPGVNPQGLAAAASNVANVATPVTGDGMIGRFVSAIIVGWIVLTVGALATGRRFSLSLGAPWGFKAAGALSADTAPVSTHTDLYKGQSADLLALSQTLAPNAGAGSLPHMVAGALPNYIPSQTGAVFST